MLGAASSMRTLGRASHGHGGARPPAPKPQHDAPRHALQPAKPRLYKPLPKRGGGGGGGIDAGSRGRAGRGDTVRDALGRARAAQGT